MNSLTKIENKIQHLQDQLDAYKIVNQILQICEATEDYYNSEYEYKGKIAKLNNFQHSQVIYGFEFSIEDFFIKNDVYLSAHIDVYISIKVNNFNKQLLIRDINPIKIAKYIESKKENTKLIFLPYRKTLLNRKYSQEFINKIDIRLIQFIKQYDFILEKTDSTLQTLLVFDI